MNTPGEQTSPPPEPSDHSQLLHSNEQQTEHDRSETDRQDPEHSDILPSIPARESESSSSTVEVKDTEMVETEKPRDLRFERFRQEFQNILSRAEGILTETQELEAIGTRLNRLAIDQRTAAKLTVSTVTLRERRAVSYDKVDKVIAACLAAGPEHHMHPDENPDSDIRIFFRLRQVAKIFVPHLMLNKDLPIHELFRGLDVMADEAKVRLSQPSLRLTIAQKTRELCQELQRVERFVRNQWEVIPGKADVRAHWNCELRGDEEHLPGTMWKNIDGMWVNSEHETQQVYKWKRTGGARERQPSLLLVPAHLHNRLDPFHAIALDLLSEIEGNTRLVTLVDCITAWLNNLAQVEEARRATRADQDTTNAADASGEDVHGTAKPDEASLRISATRAKAMRAEALQIHRERLENRSTAAEDRWQENAKYRGQRRQERLEKELRRRRLSLSESSESSESQGTSSARREGKTRPPHSELETAWSGILEAQTWTEGDRVREWRDRPPDGRLQLLIDMDKTSRQNIHDESEEWETARMAAGMVWRRLNEMQHENRDFTFEAYQATLRAEQVAREVRSPGEDDSVECEMVDQTRNFETREIGGGQRGVRFVVEDDQTELEVEDSDSEDVQAELMRLQEENLLEDEGTPTQRLSDASGEDHNLMDPESQRRANTVDQSSGLAGNPTANEAMGVGRGPAPRESVETDQS